MVVSFLGLTGPSGVLPRHYTELMLNRIRDKDYSLRDFLDLFNHRLISLFYRAWEKSRLPLGYERSRFDDPDREPDLATWALYCLVGLGTEGLRGRLVGRRSGLPLLRRPLRPFPPLGVGPGGPARRVSRAPGPHRAPPGPVARARPGEPGVDARPAPCSRGGITSSGST